MKCDAGVGDGNKREAARALAEAAQRFLAITQVASINNVIADDTIASGLRGFLADALAAYDAAPEDDGWRPIETAPKDGTRFLFSLPSGFVSVGFYIGKTPVFAADSFGGQRDTTPMQWRPLLPPTAEPAP